ncbi:MAG: S-adenosyl-L-methionine-dependent methyltransferase [Benniella sp.]|nr:MAG: S-adenosyl-L-methionine-dependent methyltransferase [Benniella sp.]
MATFSSKTFNSVLYQSFRPGYNANFYKILYNYHARNQGQFNTAVDVGTGTGQVASVLAEKFNHVHGVDASETMLASAVQKPNITYHVSVGENLSKIPSSSVDVLTVAQALHWFDHPKFFSEVKRVLKPHGTFAAVGYSFVIIEDYPRASERIRDMGNEPEQLGTLWDHGRLILDNLYKSIEVPMKNVERHYYPSGSEEHPPLMSETVTMKHMRNYLKTWSAYKTYCERYPDRRDIVDETIDAIKDENNLAEEQQVRITWPTVLILAANDA